MLWRGEERNTHSKEPMPYRTRTRQKQRRTKGRSKAEQVPSDERTQISSIMNDSCPLYIWH